MKTEDRLSGCLRALQEKTDFRPEVALILGSGLGDFADGISIAKSVPYGELDGFPVSTVAGHRGRFVFGHVADVPVVIMQGRVHYYEGYGMQDVALPTRLMGLMGAKKLILTNAAGGVNAGFSAGDFMLITDHIASFVPSPLTGPNMEWLGERFPDMSAVYDPALCGAIRRVAGREEIALREGVYMQLAGPQFETPAEVRMCRILGADAVGMSTACEALAANHMGMRVCGISCISNLASGMSGQPLTHVEVQETADRVAPLFTKLVTGAVKEIAAL